MKIFHIDNCKKIFIKDKKIFALLAKDDKYYLLSDCSLELSSYISVEEKNIKEIDNETFFKIFFENIDS